MTYSSGASSSSVSVSADPADLTVFNLDACYEIRPDTFASKGRSTPFEGARVFGKCVSTYYKGKQVYNDEKKG